jgi:hypothetical protein
MNWFNIFLISIAVSLLSYQGYSFAMVDEAAIKDSVRPPAERKVIEFDEQSFQRLKKMKPEKSFSKPDKKDFGKDHLFER